LAFLFANSFSNLSMASEGLKKTRTIALQFVGIGFYGFACTGLQNFFFCVVSHRASDNFKKWWFAALLRQDASFHDVHSVSGMATALLLASNKMRRGLGRKLREGVQFGTCFLGGLVYAFYSLWRVALVILGLLPFVSGAAFLLIQINQNKPSNDQKVRERNGGMDREREELAVFLPFDYSQLRFETSPLRPT
jgi:ATP-binding cassette subfamily B (MDR/TAP) protein 1